MAPQPLERPRDHPSEASIPAPAPGEISPVRCRYRRRVPRVQPPGAQTEDQEPAVEDGSEQAEEASATERTAPFQKKDALEPWHGKTDRPGGFDLTTRCLECPA